MTDKTQPLALMLAEQYDYGDPVAHSNTWKAAVCTELRSQHARIAELEARVQELGAMARENRSRRIVELEAQLEAVGAGGVQALSAAPAAGMTIAGDGASALGRLMREQRQSRLGVYPDGNPNAMLAASPTPPAEQQAAPKAAPGVGNSGFDHKTAADFLSGKTVGDEAVRKFVQASRWAHDEKASLGAMLLSVRGELASRNAEIALLKSALMEAEAAPQQEAQEPVALHQVYRCKIKSRKQIDREIPRELQGWWADVAAGQKLLLRQAVQSDLDRCNLSGKRSRNPDDYMCETQTNGSLVSKIALEYMHPEQNVVAAVPPPPTSAEGADHG